MCTASIWHMCTMSMDRYFTLKYPMRYGRNKTKKMVALKILFVWAISICISSPVFIHGLLDVSSVYNEKMCVPTLKNFVIYGSIFAFYIPLFIMIVTYFLTIKILYKNQKFMKRMERHDIRVKLQKINTKYNENIPMTYIDSPEKQEPHYYLPKRNTDCSFGTTFMQSSEGLKSPEQSIDILESEENTSTDSQHRIPLIQKQKSAVSLPEYASLHTTDRIQTFKKSTSQTITKSTPEDCDITRVIPVFHVGPPDTLQVSSKDRKSSSDYCLDNQRDCLLDIQQCSVSRKTKSLNELGEQTARRQKSDIQEWNDFYIQIQNEMDECLQEDTACNSYEHAETSDVYAQPLTTKNTLTVEDCRSHFTPSPGSVVFSETIESDAEESFSNNSDILTLKINPDSIRKSKHNGCVKQNGNLKGHENINSNRFNRSNAVRNDPRIDRPLYRRVSKYLSNKLQSKSNVVGLISKSTATNERKASKVLGIIFGVFLFLWTPFFVVNVISVTCDTCMEHLSGEAMSAFLWMGWVASLANPIIYTMFNTAFRKTFIRILLCQLCPTRHKKQETIMMSYTGTGPDRRGTMTLMLPSRDRYKGSIY